MSKCETNQILVSSLMGSTLVESKQVNATLSFSDILHIVANMFVDDNVTRVVIDNYSGSISVIAKPAKIDMLDYFIDCQCGYANPYHDAYFADELESEDALYAGDFTDIEREEYHRNL